MNQFDLLTRLRADPPPMSQPARERGRLTLAAHAEAVAGQRRRPRFAWRVAVPALASLTATAAVAAAMILPSPGEPDLTDTRARDLLLRAASTAEEQLIDPRPDQFIYYELVSHPSYGVVEGEYRNEITIWESVDGSRPGEVRITGIDSCDTPEPDPEPCTQTDEFWVEGTTEDLYHAPYAVLAALPTDPVAMLETIEAGAVGAGGPIEVWETASSLAERLPAPQRAALFRGLATRSDVQAVEDLTDAVGRPGVGVGIRNPKLQGALDVIMFDPSTHQYLGSKLVDETGMVTFDRALLRTGVVDEVGQVPD